MGSARMLVARVEIVGTRTLLFNRFGPDSIPLEKTERTGVAGHDPDEWKRRVCWTEQRQLYLEAAAVFASVRDGGLYTKKGRASIQRIIVATLQINDLIIPLDRHLPDGLVSRDASDPVYIDVRGVRIKASGGWNVRYRLAVSPGWKASFGLTWDKTLLSRHELHAACIDAGRYAGIGDGRRIGFGRYEVARFEVDDATDETTT